MWSNVKKNWKHIAIAVGIFLAPITGIAAYTNSSDDDVCCDRVQCEGGSVQCARLEGDGIMCYKGSGLKCKVGG